MHPFCLHQEVVKPLILLAQDANVFDFLTASEKDIQNPWFQLYQQFYHPTTGPGCGFEKTAVKTAVLNFKSKVIELWILIKKYYGGKTQEEIRALPEYLQFALFQGDSYENLKQNHEKAVAASKERKEIIARNNKRTELSFHTILGPIGADAISPSPLHHQQVNFSSVFNSMDFESSARDPVASGHGPQPIDDTASTTTTSSVGSTRVSHSFLKPPQCQAPMDAAMGLGTNPFDSSGLGGNQYDSFGQSVASAATKISMAVKEVMDGGSGGKIKEGAAKKLDPILLLEQLHASHKHHLETGDNESAEACRKRLKQVEKDLLLGDDS